MFQKTMITILRVKYNIITRQREGEENEVAVRLLLLQTLLGTVKTKAINAVNSFAAGRNPVTELLMERCHWGIH